MTLFYPFPRKDGQDWSKKEKKKTEKRARERKAINISYYDENA